MDLVAPTMVIRDAAWHVNPSMPIQRPSTVRHRTSLFEDAVAIVEAEYATELSLDDIARRVASSRRQLQRSYAEIGQTTFREHLTKIRMDRAAELLAARGLTVREVAFRVGYRQPAQFAKAFRRHHGVSPSDFRAALRMDRVARFDGLPRAGYAPAA
jgi:transcriptional regulator GlxA family with amidase domain